MTRSHSRTNGRSPGAEPGWDGPTCECCSSPARVYVLDGYADGGPLHHRYCTRCAESAPRVRQAQDSGRAGRYGLSSALGVVGAALAFAGMFGDALTGGDGGGVSGFGVYQGAGVGAGGLIIFLGAILRSDFVALIGAFVFIGSLCANWFGLVDTPGIGFWQQVLLFASALLLGLPLFTRSLKSLSKPKSPATT